MTQIQPDTEIAANVWLWDNAEFSGQAEALASVLSEEEIALRDRQFSPTKGLYWAISRARIRQKLAEMTGRSAAQIEFEEDRFGHLTLKQADLSFSVSHDGAWTALAVCETARIGIDIESIKPLSREEMEWPLSPRERCDLAGVGDEHLLQAFFRYWTLKEAFIKALGLGVSFPLEDFDMSPFGAAAALLRVAGDPDAPEEWCFEAREIRPGLRFALALKTEGNSPKLSYYEKLGH
ncbi:MAG: 4'-phosphopantetheinyl transferase superfamily protein [Hyphomonas sp.]|nr:4'-phosphopantetheinyl transferase superfamily protein [Hyphomonas sp.]